MAPFEPMLIEENVTIARVYFGDHFADFLERARALPWLSQTLYVCSHTFMMTGLVLCAVESMASAPTLVHVLSVVMYCTVGFAFWQTAQSSFRLIQPLVLLLVRSFNIWYFCVCALFFQTISSNF